MRPKIIADTEWCHNKLTSIPRRGINDYERTISFERELSDDELKEICKELQDDKDCPGWTGVRGRRIDMPKDDLFIYRFYTTWDSSD